MLQVNKDEWYREEREKEREIKKGRRRDIEREGEVRERERGERDREVKGTERERVKRGKIMTRKWVSYRDNLIYQRLTLNYITFVICKLG